MGFIEKLFSTVDSKDISLPAADAFPKSEYRAYWETFVNPDTSEWHVRLMSRDTADLLEEKMGRGDSPLSAKRAAKAWAFKQMSKYKRVV